MSLTAAFNFIKIIIFKSKEYIFVCQISKNYKIVTIISA
jgi:hypothetical protein